MDGGTNGCHDLGTCKPRYRVPVMIQEAGKSVQSVHILECSHVSRVQVGEQIVPGMVLRFKGMCMVRPGTDMVLAWFSATDT